MNILIISHRFPAKAIDRLQELGHQITQLMLLIAGEKIPVQGIDFFFVDIRVTAQKDKKTLVIQGTQIRQALIQMGIAPQKIILLKSLDDPPPDMLPVISMDPYQIGLLVDMVLAELAAASKEGAP